MKCRGNPQSHIAIAVLFGLLLLIAGVTQAGLPETVVKVKKSVVSVGTYQRLRAPAAVFKGTGFVVSKGNHVITNAHVIPDLLNHGKKEILTVFFRQGEKVEMRRAELVGNDKEHDIALLYIPGKPLPPLTLGSEAGVAEGRLYGFTGFPIGMVLGMTPVTHRGIVSAITPIAIPANTARNLDAKRLQRLRNPYKVFQLDAIAYPGNSGSPLYEVDTGAVVGVINSVLVKSTKESALTSPSGISYAIPVRYIKALLQAKGLVF
ncbi:MAG: trypsin-like peptidase domain-containing protein [Gammaproteobacteria bacterium]|nr:trypsin-like peptidase domain-containing protein [Gammaproteobacteria bacterium]